MNELLNSYINNKTDDKVIHISEVVGNRGVYTKPTPIGYSEIDSCFDGGVREGDLIVLTGLSGSGKTTLAQNMTLHISKNCVPIIWFSYEILLENLKAKFEQMSDKMNLNLKDVPIFVPKRNTSGNLSWIKNKIIECQKNINTKIVFIDHIDFISPTNLKNSDQRRMILKQICEELKLLAIDLKITIFLIAHVKKVQGREIEMQDIAESSGIYQLADYVISISRLKTKENVNGDIIEHDTNEGIVKVLKNRLTGKQPFFKFLMEDNVITPYLRQ
jgi:predicted ATP-dependent serine protease